MAAVLCGGIGKCLQGCCDCVGSICTAPFQLCGTCCRGCGQCCQDSCQLASGCCSSSFCCYISVTVGLNLPILVLGIFDLPALVANGCQASQWLLVFWILAAIHIVAAFYMARAVDGEVDAFLPSQQQQQGVSNFNASGGAGRMRHLFCYDGWMAAYIVVLVGNFVWLVLGTGVFVMDEDQRDECDGIVGKVGIAYAFGWAFLICGGCGLCCSMCCGLFRNGSGSSNPNTHFVNTNNRPTPPAVGAPIDSFTSATTKPTGKDSFTTPTPVVPVYASAPQQVEVPVASATPIYDDAPSKV